MRPQSDCTFVATFHKGATKGPKQRFVSKFIKFWTKSLYSHVELYRTATGKSCSADGYSGKVRWKDIKYSHQSRWTFVEVPNNVIEKNGMTVDKVLTFLEQQIGKKYGFRDLLRVFLFRKPNRHRKHEWFCSELILAALGFDPAQYSPGKAFDMLIDAGCRIIKP